MQGSAAGALLHGMPMACGITTICCNCSHSRPHARAAYLLHAAGADPEHVQGDALIGDTLEHGMHRQLRAVGHVVLANLQQPPKLRQAVHAGLQCTQSPDVTEASLSVAWPVCQVAHAGLHGLLITAR